MKNICCKNECFFVSVFLYVFLFSTNIFSQVDTLYFDTDGVKMSKEDFKVNIDKDFYHATMFSTDSLVEMKLKPLYCFGRLTDDLKTQLFRLLSTRHEVDTTKMLSCFYRDTLKGRSDFPLKTHIYLINKFGDTLKSGSSSNSRSINYISKQWAKEEGKIITRMNFKMVHRMNNNYIKYYHQDFKKSVELLMFYAYNNGVSDKIQGLKWHKDYGGVVNKLFSHKDEKIKYVLIKPNGEFFARYDSVGTPVSDLFNETDWNFHRDNFLKER